MAGIIPDSVRWNIVRGKQCSDIKERVKESLYEIEAEIKQAQAVEGLYQYINMSEIERVWNDLQGESEVSREAVLFFLRALNIVYFMADRDHLITS